MIRYLDVVDPRLIVTVGSDGGIHGWHGFLFGLGLSPCLMPRHACAGCPASAYTTVQTTYRDADALVAALKDLGYPVDRYAEAQLLIGYKGDVRAERAHVIVRRAYLGRSANDVGFARGADGTYSARISEYDSRATFTPTVQAKLKARYSYHAVVGAAKRKGYAVAQETSTDGKIKITLRRFA